MDRDADRPRVLIAYDRALYEGGLRALLEAHGMELVAEAGDGREAVSLARLHRPDVALLSLSTPGMDALAVARLIAAPRPDTRVVLLAPEGSDALVGEAMERGAWGYLPEGAGPGELLDLLGA